MVVAAVESLDVEVKPFGIKTLLVEPGFFRTEFLNEKNAVYVNTQIDDYKTLVDGQFATFRGSHHQQPGDPAKGAARIIDVVKSEATKGEIPFSLALGEDAVEGIRNKCTGTLELLDKWADKSSNLSF